MPSFTLDRVIAVLGLVLALPGLAVFFTVSMIAGATMVALGLLLALTWGVMWYLSRLPPFSVVAHDIELSFWGGKQHCKLDKRLQLRANHRHQRVITFRNNSSDGDFTKIFWNGERVKAAWIKREAGDTRISIPLENVPRLFETFSGTLTFHARDAFNGNPEFLIYQPDFKTKFAHIRVYLPARCIQAKFFVLAAAEVEWPEPQISADGMLIEYRLKRPKIGHEYKLVWWW